MTPGAFIHRINPGQRGHQTAICYADSVVITGWTAIPDALDISTHREMRDRIQEVYEVEVRNAASGATSFRYFLHDMQRGDYLVSPVDRGRQWHIARIEGNVYYDPSEAAAATDTAWRRPVTWLTALDSPLSPSAAHPDLRHAVKNSPVTTRQAPALYEHIVELLERAGIATQSADEDELVAARSRALGSGENAGEESAVTDALRQVAKRHANALLAVADEDDTFAAEGAIRYGIHRFRERDRKAVSQKKKSVMLSKKKLACEVCDFDFALRWPKFGDGFIECHHLTPLSEGERVTRSADLALVCSNCHRMFHRAEPGATVADLRELRASA